MAGVADSDAGATQARASNVGYDITNKVLNFHFKEDDKKKKVTIKNKGGKSPDELAYMTMLLVARCEAGASFADLMAQREELAKLSMPALEEAVQALGQRAALTRFSPGAVEVVGERYASKGPRASEVTFSRSSKALSFSFKDGVKKKFSVDLSGGVRSNEEWSRIMTLLVARCEEGASHDDLEKYRDELLERDAAAVNEAVASMGEGHRVVDLSQTNLDVSETPRPKHVAKLPAEKLVPAVVVSGEETDWPPLWAPRRDDETWHASWTVRVDEHTRALDMNFDGSSAHAAARPAPRKVDTSKLPEDFGIGVVFGGSGGGKSSLLRELEQRFSSGARAAEAAMKSAKEAKKSSLKNFFKVAAPTEADVEGPPQPPQGFHFPKGMAICSHPALAGESIDRLSCVGLNRITTWLKPPSVVSEGEKMRASCGMTLRSGAVIDDFAAVVDDRSAISMATSLAKFVRSRDYRRVLVGTTKRSVLNFLAPDFVVFADTGAVVINPNPPAKRAPSVQIHSELERYEYGSGGGWRGPLDAGDQLMPVVDPGPGPRRSAKHVPDATVPLMLACEVDSDDLCREVASAFDYDFSGQVEQRIFELRPDALSVAAPGWRLAAVAGPSGTGKSYNIRGLVGAGASKVAVEELAWDPALSVVAQVHPDAAEAAVLVRSAGLPVAAALRPFRVLSRGERERAEIARRLGSGAQEAAVVAARGGGDSGSQAENVCVCLDEFTSSLDRSTARIVCRGVSRYVRTTPLPLRVVVATVHYDILPWLLADWVLDSAVGEVTAFDGESPTAEDIDAVHESIVEADAPGAEEASELLRPPVLRFTLGRLEPARRSREVYEDIFEEHHYLNGQPPTNIHGILLREVDTRRPIAFHGIANLVCQGFGKNSFRESRLVVLPEAQGFGIGPRLSDAVGQQLVDSGCRFLSRTAHPRLGAYREAHPEKWRPTSSNKKVQHGTMATSIQDKKRKHDATVEAEQQEAGKTEAGGDESGPAPPVDALAALLRGAAAAEQKNGPGEELAAWQSRVCFAHEFIGIQPKQREPVTPPTRKGAAASKLPASESKEESRDAKRRLLGMFRN